MRALLSSPNRTVATLLGTVFVAYAVFAALTGRPVLAAVFGVAGASLVVAGALGITTARAVNIGVGTAWLVLGYAGLFVIGTPANVVGLGVLGEVALFATATVLLAVGLGARPDTRVRQESQLG